MAPTGTTNRQRAGLALAALLSVGNIVSVGSPTPEGEVGPPMVVLVLGAALGVVGLVATVLAWRSGDRRLLRVVCATVAVSALIAVPGFFVPIPPAVKMLVGTVVLASLLACVLVLSPSRTAPAPVRA